MISPRKLENQPVPIPPKHFPIEEMILQWEEELGVSRHQILETMAFYESDPRYQADFLMEDERTTEISGELTGLIAQDLRRGKVRKPRELKLDIGTEATEDDVEPLPGRKGRRKAVATLAGGQEPEKTVLGYAKEKREEEKTKSLEWVTVDSVVDEVMTTVRLPKDRMLQIFSGFYRTRKGDFEIRYVKKEASHINKAGNYMMCSPAVAEELRSYFRAVLSIE